MTAHRAARAQRTQLICLIVAMMQLLSLAGAAQAAWSTPSQLPIPIISSSSSGVMQWPPSPHQQKLLWQQSITPLQNERPYVIAHRGASGLLPEHTLPAYTRAIAQGADFIECDIVVTKDLQLICRHEPELNSTTDVMSLFPDKLKTYEIDGESVTSVFASDLTLAEIKQLHAKQRWRFRDHSHDGKYQIPTLDEFLQLAESSSKASGRAIGIYPELKHPTWHNSLPQMKAAGTTIEELVIKKLQAWGYGGSAPVGSPAWRLKPVFVQCFEPSSLRKVADMTDMPLVLLLGGWDDTAPDVGLSLEEMTTDEYLQQLKEYVSGIGPSKSTLYVDGGRKDAATVAGSFLEHKSSSATDSSNNNSNSDATPVSSDSSACRSGRCSGFLSAVSAHESSSGGSSSSDEQSENELMSTGLVAKLQKHGFQVHPYTVRDESQFVPSGCEGDIECEFAWLIDQEAVDGVFTDFPGALVDWLSSREPEN